jgi:CheY-like chemotaxis protein
MMIALSSGARSVVLLVEDEALIRMSAADTLDDAGYRVVEAVHADEALLLLQARPDIQVLVTDVDMKGGSIDGFALARQVHERWPWVAIIVMSGRMMPGPGDLPEKAEFITKPYRSSALVEAVERNAR